MQRDNNKQLFLVISDCLPSGAVVTLEVLRRIKGYKTIVPIEGESTAILVSRELIAQKNGEQPVSR